MNKTIGPCYWDPVEKAAEGVLSGLQKQPMTLPHHPAYPKYYSKTSSTK